MKVVSDSSAIVVLVNIGLIELLPALFVRILIPTAVARELSSEKRTEVVRRFIASPLNGSISGRPTVEKRFQALMKARHRRSLLLRKSRQTGSFWMNPMAEDPPSIAN